MANIKIRKNGEWKNISSIDEVLEESGGSSLVTVASKIANPDDWKNDGTGYNIGSQKQPVYFENGVPKQISYEI